MEMNPKHSLEEILAVLDAHIASKPEAILPRFQRAGVLFALDRIEEAQTAYLEVLRREPTHFGAWTDLGKILFETGRTSAARTAYSAAVTYHPDNPIARGNIAELHLNEGELEPALLHYQFVLDHDPANVRADQGLSAIYWGMGDEKNATYHRHLGFHNRLGTPLPFRGTGEPIPLLVLIAAACGNVHWHKLFDDRVFQATTLVPDCYDRELPDHRLIFNAIGDADLCSPSLEAANAILEQTSAPVINCPSAVLATGRLSNAERLKKLLNVVTPRMVLLPAHVCLAPTQ